MCTLALLYVDVNIVVGVSVVPIIHVYAHYRWIRRWFEVEDRVLYCYNAQDQDESKVKRAAVLYQASVKVFHIMPII